MKMADVFNLGGESIAPGDSMRSIQGPHFDQHNHGSASAPMPAAGEGLMMSIQGPHFFELNHGSASALMPAAGDELVMIMQGPHFDQLNHCSASAAMPAAGDNFVKIMQGPHFDQLKHGSASAAMPAAGDNFVKIMQGPHFDQLKHGSASAAMPAAGDDLMMIMQGTHFDQLNHGSASVPMPAAGDFIGCPPNSPIQGSPGWGTRASTNDCYNTQTRNPSHRSLAEMQSSNTNNNREVRIRIADAEFVTKEPLFNPGKMTKVCLVIVAQVALTLSTIGSISSGNTSFSSPYANILLDFAKICNVIAFICFLYGIFVCGRRNPGVLGARVLIGMGYVATIYGLLAVMCMELLDKQALQLWITVAVFVVCIPALAAAFRR